MGLITRILGIDSKIKSLEFKVKSLEQHTLKLTPTKYNVGDEIKFAFVSDIIMPSRSGNGKGIIIKVRKERTCCGVSVKYDVFSGGLLVKVSQHSIDVAMKPRIEDK